MKWVLNGCTGNTAKCGVRPLLRELLSSIHLCAHTAVERHPYVIQHYSREEHWHWQRLPGVVPSGDTSGQVHTTDVHPFRLQ